MGSKFKIGRYGIDIKQPTDTHDIWITKITIDDIKITKTTPRYITLHIKTHHGLLYSLDDVILRRKIYTDEYDNEYLNNYNDEKEFIIKNTEVMINKYMIIGEYSDGENIKIVRFKNFNDIKLDADYYTESEVKLLGIQLNIKNNGNIKESLPILFYKNCNHFIENNILFDRKFINYYLKTEKMDVLEIDDNYEIIFFDNDINTHTITDPQYIKINKENFETIENNDNYEILNNPNNPNDNFEENNDVNKNIPITNRISNIINSINWIGPIYAGQDEDY